MSTTKCLENLKDSNNGERKKRKKVESLRHEISCRGAFDDLADLLVGDEETET